MESTNSLYRCPKRSRISTSTERALILATLSSLFTCVVAKSRPSSWPWQPKTYDHYNWAFQSREAGAAFADRSRCLPDLRFNFILNTPVCFPAENFPLKRRYSPRLSRDYETADEIRRSIDEIRIVIPWSAIVSAHPELQTDLSLLEFSEQPPFYMNDINGSKFDLEYKVLVTDVPRSQGGRSTWELISTKDTIETFFSASHINSSNSSDTYSYDKNKRKEDNVLQLAHAALGMAVSSSERGCDVDEAALQRLVQRARNRLRTIRRKKAMSGLFPEVSGAGELHGRKAADAVLWFALAGVKDDGEDHRSSLYDALVTIAKEELIRFGSKSSCRAKDIMHIVERVAMAGIVSAATRELYEVAADCLEDKISSGMTPNTKEDEMNPNSHDNDDDGDNHVDIEGGIDYPTTIQSLRDSSFGLHSDRPLLGLWRFSTRQRKQRSFFQNAARHYDNQFPGDGTVSPTTNKTDDGREGKRGQYDWSSLFRNPTRPLVVDVGCGMGVSLLGLAKICADDNGNINNSKVVGDGSVYQTHSSDIPINWKECNFIGVDLSRLAIRYARGVNERWGLGHCLNFVVDPAEECLENIIYSYPGEVKLVMVQFPTPFRFQCGDEDDGDEDNEGEKGRESVAQKGYNAQLPTDAKAVFMVTEKLLSQIHNVISKNNGMLLLQSNCEDVAVFMRNTAIEKCGFHSRDASYPVVTSLDLSTANMPKRALDYISMGGERAIGTGWSDRPLLPCGGRTETEVACMLDDKPVHRCLLVTERDQ
ncbi:hypothetical protein ACHAXS_003559 [Conticribra weissflogii]